MTTPSGLESIPPSEAFSPASDVHSDKSSPPLRPSHVLSRSNSAASTARLTNGSTPLTNGTTPSSVQTPPVSTSPSPGNTDVMWQAALQQMMNSPGQFQRLMQAFANQQPVASLPTQADANGNANLNLNLPNSAIAAYDPAPPADYSRWFTPSAPSTSSATLSQSLLAHAPSPPPAPGPGDENSPLQLLLDESSRLQKSYRDAAEIDADMDMLQSSINSFIQNLGIDPTSLAQPPRDGAVSPSPATAHMGVGVNGNGNGVLPSTNGYGAAEAFVNGFGGLSGLNGLDPGGADAASQPDHLLDSLLSQIGDGSVGAGAGMGTGASMDMTGGVGGVGVGVGVGPMGMDGMGGYSDITDHYDHSARIDGTSIEDASTEQLAAFLEEASAGANSGSGAADSPGRMKSPVQHQHQKRKSDAVDLPLPNPPEGGTGKKVKRKR